MTEAEASALRQEISDLRRVLRVVIYGVLLAVAAPLAVGVGNVAYTNSVDHRRRVEAVEQDRARAAAGEQTRQLVCSLATAQAEAFQDATSPAGQRSLAAWVAMVDRFHCS